MAGARLKLLAGAWVLALATPVWAINKCTGPDGKVTYQEAQCPSASTAADEVKTWGAGGRPGERWLFTRQKDEMTGAVVCFAGSPYTYVMAARNAVAVRLLVAYGKGARVVTVRTIEVGGDLFHNDLIGMGVKVDGNEFLPITRSVNQHAVGFSPVAQEQLIGQLDGARSIKLRVRFWPYDSLRDSEALPTDGMKQSLAAAQACAAQL